MNNRSFKPRGSTFRRAIRLSGRLSLALLVPALLSCGGPAPARKGMVLVSSFYPVHVMALNVAGGVPGMELRNLAPSATGCLHDYSLSAEDMKRLDGADLFAMNGAGMESFFQDIAERNPGLRTASLAEAAGIGAGGGEVNPHAWVSPALAALEVRALADFMAVADLPNAETYRKQGGIYADKIEKLGARMHAALEKYRGEKIVTFHEAFPYFAEEFGFEIVAVVEREPGTEPSAAELAGAIDAVRASGARTIFVEPQYPRGPAEAIARETGAKVLELDPGVTPPPAGSGVADADSYLDAMERNLATLLEAFGDGGK